MDRQVQKIKYYLDKYLGKTTTQVGESLGKPGKYSDTEILFYHQYRYGIFKDEIAFIFEEDRVIDIVITECILWMEYKNIFYFEGQNPEYKVSDLF